MYSNATPTSPLKAFMLILIYLVYLVGLPPVKVSAKKPPVTNIVSTNDVTTWLDNYLFHHPYSPLFYEAIDQVNAVDNATYSVETISSSGCVKPVRKTMYMTVGLPQPLVTPAVSTINIGQTATFTVDNPNPGYQYNWYNASAGGALVQGNSTTFTTPALSAAAVYYVEVRDPVNNFTSPARTMVRVDINMRTEPTPCSYATQQASPVISGICLLCSVADPTLAVDQNSNSASTITATLSAVGYVGQLLRFPNTYPAGDSVTLDLEIPGQVADLALLGGVRLETYNGNAPNADAIFLNNSIVHVTLLNTGNKFRVTLPVTKAFNGVMISINGVLAALTRVKVYFAAVITRRPQVASANVNVCSGNPATLIATSSNDADLTWYTAAVGGTPLHVGGTYTTPALTASATYYVDAGRFGCANLNRVPVTVNVVPGLVAPTTTNATICAGQQATLTANVSGQNIQTHWYTAPTGGTLLFTGTTYVTNALNADTAFYVETGNGTCTLSSRIKVTVTVGARPVAPTLVSDNVEVCAGQNAELFIKDQQNDLSYQFYTAPTGGTLVSTGPVFVVIGITADVTFYVQAVNSNGCANAGARVPVAIKVAQVPETPIVSASNVTVCPGSTVTLSVQNPNAAFSYRWYTTATGGTPLDSGSSFTTPVVNTATNYYVEAGNGNCGSAARAAVTVGVSATPPVPVLEANDVSACTGKATLRVISDTSGVTYNWYTGATGGTPVFSGPEFTPTVTNTTTYYVEAVSANNQCTGTSPRVAATVTVGASPDVPVLTYRNPIIVCAGEDVTLFVRDPNAAFTYHWYTTATGGTPIASGSSFTTPIINTAVNYYVEAVNGSCSSPARAEAAIFASTAPPVPVVEANNVSICTGETATLRVISSTNGMIYSWYTVASGGTSVFDGPEFTTPALNNTTTYYVAGTTTDNRCIGTSARVAVTVTVGASPDVPVLTYRNPIIVCAGEDVTLFVRDPNAAFTYHWYTTATGGTPIASGSSFTTPIINTAVNYYVEAVNGSCSSPARAEAAIFASTAPPVPVVEANNVSICTGETATLRVISSTNGMIYSWYTVASGGTSVFDGPEFTTPALNNTTTYYVAGTTTDNRCIGTSARVAVTVTVGASLDVPVLTYRNPIIVCAGEDVTLFVRDPNATFTYHWYTTATGGTPIASGSSFTTPIINTAVNYYVEAVNGSCSSPARAEAAIFASTAPPVPVVEANNVSICTGETATLRVISSTNGMIYSWYTVASGGTSVFDGPEFTTPALNNTTTYYVAGTTTDNRCIGTSARVAVTVTVGASQATVTGNEAGICPGDMATLTATSTTPNAGFRWYTTATGGTPVSTTATFTTPALNQNTTYYVEVVTAGGCTSASRIAVQVNILVPLATPVVTVNQTTATSVTFGWTAIPGAVAYQVTLDNGVNYVAPSSGAEGLTHTITGLLPGQSVTIRVRALGGSDCEVSALSAAVTGTVENPLGNNIFVPNVFTPNGDGFNDVHYVYGNTIVSVVMRYYNQFGQQIFETKDQRTGWDGTIGGRQQPVGVYIYVLRATLQDGSAVNRKGTVTIVR